MAEKKAKQESRALTAWDPFGEVEPWSNLFEGLSGRFPRLVDELFRERAWPGRGRGFLPALDVSDNEQQYTLSVELPGVRKEDVHIELQEGMLTVRGEKKSEREEKKEQSRYVERSYGSFTRSLRIPPDADADRLAASFKDGVLTITIPKSEEAKPRTIAIK